MIGPALTLTAIGVVLLATGYFTNRPDLIILAIFPLLPGATVLVLEIGDR